MTTTDKKKVLILGASYGSLLGMKLVLAGHDVTLVCLPAEAALINEEGARVRMPVRGRDGLVTLDSRSAPGTLSAAGPEDVDPAAFDLIGLAMQEPQYAHPAIRALMGKVAESAVPVMSIMNMPPLPFLARLPGVDTTMLRGAYRDARVWDAFEPARVTLASPDPQAFRPPEEPMNVLQVSLPTNFKVAAFDDPAHTALLRQLEADVDAIRHAEEGEMLELPVKLRVFDSLYVPLAKWAMLLTGNYRCVTPEGPRAIRDAVHSDPAASEAIYAWVKEVCVALGAAPGDLVPFEKYANAAKGLAKPSSAARALYAGAPAIERVDRIVQALARTQGRSHPVLDETVALVDAQLARNATDHAA
ncbi:MAG: hypothetical protein AAFQ81_15540 [Pseudomonadota bacterium]